MKFKAKLIGDSIPWFIMNIEAVQKVNVSDCVVFMSRESFEIRITNFDSGKEILLFAKFNRTLFHEYIIESKADNTIAFVISMSSLIAGFLSARQSDEAVFKLTKKSGGSPCFTISTPTMKNVSVVQDIPILKILTKDETAEFQEPVLPKPQIVLKFPDPRHVRAVLDRMKAISKTVTLNFTSHGSMVIKTQTEIVSMRTIWQNLLMDNSSINQSESDMEVEEDPNQTVSSSNQSEKKKRKIKCKVQANIKDLIPITSCHLARYKNILICVSVPKQTLIIYVMLDNDLGTLVYYVPVMCNHEESETSAVEESDSKVLEAWNNIASLTESENDENVVIKEEHPSQQDE